MKALWCDEGNHRNGQEPVAAPVASATPAFSVALSVGLGYARLQLQGELDRAAVQALTERFEQACAHDVQHIVFDAYELRYCDSSGIRALLGCAARCVRDGREMRVLGARGTVRRVIDLTDTAQTLNVADPD